MEESSNRKVLLHMTMKASHAGEVVLSTRAFEISKETENLYYRGELIDGEGWTHTVYEKRQYRKSTLPERENCNQDRTIEFSIKDVCLAEDIGKVAEVHLKELINKMENELTRRRELLNQWITSVSNSTGP